MLSEVGVEAAVDGGLTRRGVDDAPPGCRPGAAIGNLGGAGVNSDPEELLVAALLRYAALRAIRMYPLENAAVQNSIAELTTLATEFVAHEHELARCACRVSLRS